MILKTNKKIIIYLVSIFIFICIFCIPYYNCYASNTGSIYLSSNKNVLEKEEELEITLNLENNKTAAFTSYLYFDDSKLEYISGPENTNLVGNRLVFIWFDTTGGDNAKEGELAKFKFKAKEYGVANFVIEGEFYNKIGQLIQTDYKQIQIQIGKEESKLQKEESEEQGTDTQSQNAALQALRLDKEGLITNFEKDIYEYYLTISNEINDIEVLAITENPNATIEITGNTNLKEGLNAITIIVTSEDKTKTNTYTIQVTKTANINLANTNLEILAIENILLYPPFDTNVTNYKAEVSNEVSNLNILAVPENENATVEVVGKDIIKEGNNIININVTAPNGFTKRVYEVNVYRRNQEEEIKYQEEQKANQEKLEEIYKIEKTSNEFDKEIESEEEIQQKQRISIIIIIAVILAIFIGVALYMWRKKKVKKDSNVKQ